MVLNKIRSPTGKKGLKMTKRMRNKPRKPMMESSQRMMNLMRTELMVKPRELKTWNPRSKIFPIENELIGRESQRKKMRKAMKRPETTNNKPGKNQSLKRRNLRMKSMKLKTMN
uniref:Uncharacterized protein n=1 Tax=Cacopsylla melanoneura TaxID=428564 RepID=A0A8D8YED6_9HEMI